MPVRYTQPFLNKMEALIAEAGYILRYEKGSFNSGYCLLKDTKVAVINKYFPLEGRINALAEILRSIPVDLSTLSDKSRQVYRELTAETAASEGPLSEKSEGS